MEYIFTVNTCTVELQAVCVLYNNVQWSYPGRKCELAVQKNFHTSNHRDTNRFYWATKIINSHKD
jgi:hypothetical protein